jgi:hypothetical protein
MDSIKNRASQKARSLFELRNKNSALGAQGAIIKGEIWHTVFDQVELVFT